MERKFLTELALSFYSDGLLTLHAADLKRIADGTAEEIAQAERCHIYLITKRPRIWFVPGSITWANGKTTGKFAHSKGGVFTEVAFAMKGEPKVDEVRIDPYPHAKISLIKGSESMVIPAHHLVMLCDELEDMSLRDLEVAYVGMSYGDGSRSAKERLVGHATLQQVLADMNRDEPDMQAIIVMVEFASPQTIISFDGRDKSLQLKPDRDVVDDIERLRNEISEEGEIRLIEAGLIRYFVPAYNEKYTARFPHPTHEILRKLYEIDLPALTVELNTEEIFARLWSKTRLPGFHHLASFDLHDASVRQSFFAVVKGDTVNTGASNSGPLF